MMLKALPAEAARLDPAALIRYAEEPEYREAGGRAELSLLGRRLVSGGGYWDPAYGRPGSGDSSVLAACYADQEGNHFLHRLRYLTHDPDAAADPATQQCQQVAAIARDLLLPVIRVETNGIGRFLPALLRREFQHFLLRPVLELKSQKEKKHENSMAKCTLWNMPSKPILQL